MARLTLKVNGKNQTIDAEPDMPLLYALRNDLQLNGPKFGCGLSQCGACTVIMDGNAIRSCVTPVSAAQNKSVTTLEGLGTTKKMHKIQQAFVDEQAVQCGYCINGMIMSTKALLDKNPKPTDSQIKTALAGNLCRCGTHIRILRAVKRASGQSAMKGDEDEIHGHHSQTISQRRRRADRQLQSFSLPLHRLSRSRTCCRTAISIPHSWIPGSPSAKTAR